MGRRRHIRSVTGLTIPGPSDQKDGEPERPREPEALTEPLAVVQRTQRSWVVRSPCVLSRTRDCCNNVKRNA